MWEWLYLMSARWLTSTTLNNFHLATMLTQNSKFLTVGFIFVVASFNNCIYRDLRPIRDVLHCL